MPTLSLAMNIGALFGLTTSTPGSVPKMGASGFEALLAGLLSGFGSPPVDGVFQVPSGGPPGEWPPPPPPPLAGLGVEELKTSEPNAPSKKPDLPAPTEAQLIPSLGLVSMAMPILATENSQVEAFLEAPLTASRVPNLSDRPLALMADGPTQPVSASTDPREAAFSKLLDSPELNVKMVRIDVPNVESPGRTAQSTSFDLVALQPNSPAAAIAKAVDPDLPSTQGADTSMAAVESPGTQEDTRQALPLTPEIAPDHENPQLQTLPTPTTGSTKPLNAARESAPTDRLGDVEAQLLGDQTPRLPVEPAAAADPESVPFPHEPGTPKPHMGQTSESETADKPVLEQPEGERSSINASASHQQDTTMSDSAAERDNLDEEPEGEKGSSQSEPGRHQLEFATGRRADETLAHPEPAETVGGVRSASRAQLVHADRIEAFAATRPRGTITIDMDPLDLGKIQLVVKQSEGMIEAHVVAQDERVRQALQASQAHLVQSFENRGVRLDQFQVSAPSSSTTAEFGREHRQPPQPAQQPPQHGRLSQQASSRPVLVASTRGGVDLTI